MTYFILSFEVIFPILFFMVVGYVVMRLELVSKQGFDAMNKMVFRIFLPLKLFMDIMNSDFESSFQIKLVAFAVLGISAGAVVLYFAVPKFIKQPQNASVAIQAIVRGNYVIFGFAVAANLYPNIDIGITSVLAAFIIPLFNIGSVILFELFRGVEIKFEQIVIGIIKNPFMQVSILSTVLMVLKIQIPNLMMKPLNDMAATATPIAIICLGASFSFMALKKYASILISVCLGKLVILPSIFIGIGLLLGFRNIELAAIMILFGSPTAAGSYTMAKELGGNGELAGMLVAVTSMASIVTMCFWIFILKYFQFM